MAIIVPSILAAHPVNMQRDLTMKERTCAKRFAGAGRGGIFLAGRAKR